MINIEIMSLCIHNETQIYNVKWVKLYPVDVMLLTQISRW